MKLTWRNIELPNFGVTEEMPQISKEVYETRCRNYYDKCKSDYVVIYGDREHFANLHYLTEFDPRFEEALLILGPKNTKYLLVGNEGLMYKNVVKPNVEVILCQMFSLMGQDRTLSSSLYEILKEIGMKKGSTVGICGWKYLDEDDDLGIKSYFAPSFLLAHIKAIIGSMEGVTDVTSILMHPTKGMRAYNEIEQIAVFEWGATRASSALWKIVKGTTPGVSEMKAVSNMGYSGEPLTAYVMYASGKDEIVGLRSPNSKVIQKGDGVFTAVGYRGGLSCRAGLVKKEDTEFIEKWAKPYYAGIATWYESVSVGVKGGDIYSAVKEQMEKGGLSPALNPGHLTSSDEWLHTPFRPDSTEEIQSGMAIQCDIIPTPMEDGITLNSEDSVFLADESLRRKIAEKYPSMWKRIQDRQDFMRSNLGLNISDDILPFSATPGYYAPLLLSPNYVITKD